MDPTRSGFNGAITFLNPTALDLIAFDAIGYDVAVPEPATWAMMIAGFGFVGAAMRRRRRTVQVSFG
ncbi:MAG: PEP-CTERM sorting domain-containing protein [Proteobacteria bacterium]|nr:PEP-CTERM sorting domain-containing protein [Pseudomonadota bacterium]